MKIKVNPSAVLQTKWYEYAARFLIGGGITIVAGLIAKRFGPSIGGLFLAFPAIFPASATLIQKHEEEKKRNAGLRPGKRGRIAVALDAAGATMGGVAMIAFAGFMWRFLPDHHAAAVLGLGIFVWLLIAVAVWRIEDAL